MAVKFSIGQFSKATGIPAKTLRFYHEKELLVPPIVDAASGYRFYDQRSVERAHVILALRKLDFPLDEIAAILAESDDDSDLIERLERRKGDIGREIERFRDMVGIIDGIVAQEREARRVMADPQQAVVVAELPAMLAAGVRVKGRYQDSGPAFGSLGRKIGRYITGKPLCLYYDEDYREDDADFQPCFPVSPKVKGEGIEIFELPACRALTMRHVGPYPELGRSYAKLFTHAAAQAIEPRLPSREVYLKGPGMIFKGNPRKYVTEIQVPIDS